jgi:hypothetical protein
MLTEGKGGEEGGMGGHKETKEGMGEAEGAKGEERRALTDLKPFPHPFPVVAAGLHALWRRDAASDGPRPPG